MPQLLPALAATFTAAKTAFTAFAATTLGKFTVQLLASVALSALSAALAPKPKPVGIRTSSTMTGGVNPEGFILGYYATEGALVSPPMAHGLAGKTPNAYLNYVIEVGGIPGQTLAGLILDGEEAEILTGSPHPDYGQRIGGRYLNRAWVRYYDGTQTTADAMLLAKYPAPYARPWTTAMVGAGICYAVLTFQYDRDVYKGFPRVRFILNGVPLYDPRLDSTAGGSGAHRFGTPSTYEVSTNPAVQIYNILRGVTLPGANIWGGESVAADLPYSVWAAAMNACDALVDNGAGGTEKRYRAGLEVLAEDEPFGVIEELLKACNGQLHEDGGVWTLNVGGPGLPAAFITDDDVIISEPQDFDPFPTPEQTYNVVTASHPSPAALWEPRDTPAIYNSTWEAEDGGRRLPASVTLPAAPYPVQVQRITAALAADHRRMRRHILTLPPDASALQTGDVVSWTSAANSYTAKQFEIAETVRDLRTGLMRVSLREVDPADYVAPSGLLAPPVIVITPQRPAPQVVPGFTVAPASIDDGDDEPRRPAIAISWTADGADDAEGIRWAIRIAGHIGPGTVSAIHDVKTGGAVVEALPATAYEVRGRLVANRPTEWTEWVAVTTPDVRLKVVDVAPDFFADMPPELRPVEVLSALPTTGNFAGRMVFLTTDNKLYRHTGSPSGAAGFTAAVATVDLTGTISEGQLASSSVTAAKIASNAVTAVKIASLAVTEAKVAANAITTAKIAASAVDAAKLATNAVTAEKIAELAVTEAKVAANAITTAKLANLAVDAAKLADGAATEAKIAANAITETKISDNAISSPKIVAGAIVAGKIAANAVTAGSIAANAVQAGNIAAGAVTAGTVAANAITATEIAAGAITANEIAASAVTAVKLAAGSVEAAKIAAGAVLAGSIAAGAVTTAKLDALAVTAEKVAAGAIVADKIAANAVTAAKIIAGAIETAKIAAGAVVADKIAANAITTDKLAANAITSDKIAANAITTDKLAANAITSDKIAANQITAGLIAAGAVSASKIQLDGVTLEGDGTGKLIIKNGGVATEKIAANAVTVPSSISRTGFEGQAGRLIFDDGSPDPPSEATIGSLTVTRAGQPARIQFDVFIQKIGTGSSEPFFQIRRNGTAIKDFIVEMDWKEGTQLISLTFTDTGVSGSTTYDLLVSAFFGLTDDSYLFQDCSTFILETKR
jgi:hypothetical protein